MQVIVNIAAFLIVLGLAVSVQGAEPGKIRGSVNYCDQGGVLAMKVSLSGRQASVYTADDGKFLFEAVPQGKYALFYAIDEKLVHISKDLVVKSGETTDLGEVAFCAAKKADVEMGESKVTTKQECPPASLAPECIDNDKDGVVAAEDCDDNNDRVRPGAPELCDGIDNNCNAEIDESGAVWIENGEGICQNGSIIVKSCNKGFADCDNQPSNGCETNIMKDNDNCGACGKVCPSLEICVGGIC